MKLNFNDYQPNKGPGMIDQLKEIKQTSKKKYWIHEEH